MGGNPGTTINRLERGQETRAGILLARAFFDDPLFRFFEPDAKNRLRLLTWYLTMAVRYCMHYGEIEAARDLEGIACWLPPTQTQTTIIKYLRVGFRSIPTQFNLSALRRAAAYDMFSQGIQQNCVPAPHWYLVLLGILPERQGQGIGTMMVKARLASFDRDALPCYLETSGSKNVAFYQRLGFNVVYEGFIPGSQVPLWAMLRKPRAL